MPTDLITSHRVRTRLGRLHVRTTGTGPATVLWASMFVDGHTMDGLLPLLPDRRLVVVDGPGIGGSDPLVRRSTIREAAGAAVDLLTGPQAGELGIDGPVDWVGNAFGGHVGYELAGDPALLRTLVAISAPTEPVPDELRRQIAVLAPLLRALGPVGPVRAAIHRALLSEASVADPAIRAVVDESLVRPSRRSLALALRSFVVDRTDVTAGMSRIAVPCLFVTGDQRGDWTPEAAERTAALVPGARAVTVPGASTLVPLEQPAALAAALRRFWAEQG
ncbi:pimeloyl-ACP methyl ester carboxylesterase [Friedmanniella endophytica]|uniref:Pimeloyl-ACP methyl ester carboxylesterase n=1 Tax=Microlunatus kandeliicorticis TaxID=1759536 RepID=A0A7W3P4M9_9ACTN|nr:alpha/beta hydrolase [Microlunatus kandeliicorticis]MBA8793002.1 pimeloyl-ACP methyl ester carboxylesterase [Microlunatus kandeliicorticis]